MDVTHSEILLPAKLEGAEVQWARDRTRLWKAAEQAKEGPKARVAREFQVALPSELSAQQRLRLARTFSQELADRFRVAVDLVIHEPRPDGGPRNVHAHLLATNRQVTLSGLGAPAAAPQLTELRARWVSLTQEALHAAGIDARLDQPSSGPPGPENIGRDAARAWRQKRSAEAEPVEAGQTKSPRLERAADDDYLP
ncbi:MAG TPA: MobA/MobL family protein [Steroidobacteraceae bacterium]|nr:MobA/MobL family protein [Steroidobacteraceae bacterium]